MRSFKLLIVVLAARCNCSPFKLSTKMNLDGREIDANILIGDDAKNYARSVGAFKRLKEPSSQLGLNTITGDVFTENVKAPSLSVPHGNNNDLNISYSQLRSDAIKSAFFTGNEAESVNVPKPQLETNALSKPFFNGDEAKRHAALYGKIEGVNIPRTQLETNALNKPFFTGDEAKRHAALYGKIEGVNIPTTQLETNALNKPFFTGDEANRHAALYGKMEGVNVPKTLLGARGFINDNETSGQDSKKTKPEASSSGSIRVSQSHQNSFLLSLELLLLTFLVFC